MDASLFTTDTATQCAFNIIPSDLDTESPNDVHSYSDNNTGIHFYSKYKYRDTFGDAHIQYHDLDNDDAFVYKDKYTALLQQELQNPYWCLHDPITTQSYQISPDMDIETMPYTLIAMQVQSLRLTMFHTKLYSTMIKVCSQLN